MFAYLSVRGSESSVIFREFSESGPEKCVTLQSFSCTFIEPITNQFDLVTVSNTPSQHIPQGRNKLPVMCLGVAAASA